MAGFRTKVGKFGPTRGSPLLSYFKIHSGPEMVARISGDGGGVLEVFLFFILLREGNDLILDSDIVVTGNKIILG